MEMPAFDQIVLPHMILLVPDVITAIAIIEAAVAAITKVVVAVIIFHTIPGEAILATDTTEATQDGDPIHMTRHALGHLTDTTADPNLANDIDPTPTARAGLKITSIPSLLRDLPGGNDTESIEAVCCSHQ